MMRPFVKVTCSRTWVRRSQPAPTSVGVMNWVQMSCSLRSALSVMAFFTWAFDIDSLDTPRNMGNMHQFNRPLFGHLDPSIVTQCRHRVLVASQALDGCHIHADVKQATDERPPHVVRREW